MLMKDRKCTCLDGILGKINPKQFSKAEKCMISEIITICKLCLVNSAIKAAGERSFSTARRLDCKRSWLRSMLTQTSFFNLQTNYFVDLANEFAARSQRQSRNLFWDFQRFRLKNVRVTPFCCVCWM